MNTFQMKLRTYAPLVLRYGLAFVFLWFSFSQFQDPSRWTGFIPDFITSLGFSAVHFVQMNALLELVGGTLLLLGAFTPLVALILAVHMAAISLSIGMTAVGVRDIGLSVATLVLAMLGSGPFAVDTLPKNTPAPTQTVVS